MQRMTDCKYTAKVIFSLFLEERKRDRRMYYIGDWKQQFLISVMLLTVILRHQDIYIYTSFWMAWRNQLKINGLLEVESIFELTAGLIAACANQTFNSNSFILGCVQLMPCSYVSLLKKKPILFWLRLQKEGERLFAKTK